MRAQRGKLMMTVACICVAVSLSQRTSVRGQVVPSSPVKIYRGAISDLHIEMRLRTDWKNAPGSALAQGTSETAAAGPEKIVRDFYSWYLHELNKENAKPLKQKATALKYLTPQLYAGVPRLERQSTADIFVCAQDWNEAWERNFVVEPVSIKGISAATRVTLSSGETDKLRIKVTLKRTNVGWRIDRVACAN
jgi:hypothetical protein